MKTSGLLTASRKILIAGALTATVAIGGSMIFLMNDSRPEIPATSERFSPAQGTEESATVPVQLTSPSAVHASGSAPIQRSAADDSLIAVHERSTQLAVELSRLSSTQAQTEARIQEIATKFLGSPVEVPSYEQQQVRMQQYRSEVETQRQAVEKYEKEAIALARQHGIPEAVVRSNTFGEVQRYSAGRGSLELTKALTHVIHQRKIVEAAEKRHKELSQLQTLPSKAR